MIDIKSKTIHAEGCETLQDMAVRNRQETDKNLDELLEEGYAKCSICIKDET